MRKPKKKEAAIFLNLKMDLPLTDQIEKILRVTPITAAVQTAKQDKQESGSFFTQKNAYSRERKSRITTGKNISIRSLKKKDANVRRVKKSEIKITNKIASIDGSLYHMHIFSLRSCLRFIYNQNIFFRSLACA